MEKQKQTLIYASAFFFGCVVADIIHLIRVLTNGSLTFSPAELGVSEETAQTVVTIILSILVALVAIGVILKLYLAIKGVRQAYGKGGKGKAHITWAKIIAVLLVVSTVATIYGIAQGTEGWYSLLSPIVSLVAAFFYIKSATALKGDAAQ